MRYSPPFIAILILSVFLFQQTKADIVTLGASIEISGGASPVGTPPWVTAAFDDNNSQGTVTLVLSNPNLTGSEFVSSWYLNLDPSLNPNDLQFGSFSKTGSFTDPTITTSADTYKADGDGYADILFSFATGGGASSRFGAGEALTVQITGIPTLTAHSFDWPTVNGSVNNNAHLMVAHVQSIGPGSDSGWVATPEPAPFVLLICGLAVFCLKRFGGY